MIKLICSDIDGTLLLNGETELSPKLFNQIHELNQHGIVFMPTSGRQYHSVRNLFMPCADQIVILCENGAEVYRPCPCEEDAKPIISQTIDYNQCCELIDDILSLPQCSALISCSNMSYLISRHDEFVHQMKDINKNRFTMVSSTAEIPQKIIKLAAFCSDGSKKADSILGPKWRKRGFDVAQAGYYWLDFNTATKASGLIKICSQLNISLSDVVAFGDNYNDVPLLDVVGYPYIMETSSEALKARYSRHCSRVENILDSFLSEL